MKRHLSPEVRSVAALLAILLLATELRGLRLDLEGIGSDEAFTWSMAHPPFTAMVQRILGDIHPPLYYVLLYGWFSSWGDSLGSLRSFSILFGLLTVAGAWALGREASRLYGGPSWAALAAALLVAVHSGPLQASRMGRMYSLGAFLVTLSATLLLRALRQPFRGRWAAYGFAMALFAYVHYYAFYSLLAQVVFVAHGWASRRVLEPEKARRIAFGFLLAFGIAAALYLPWLPIFQKQAAMVARELTALPARLDMLPQLLASWAAGLRLASASAMALVASWVAVAAWVAARGPVAPRLFLAQAVLPVTLAGFVSLVSGRPLVEERYLGFAQVMLLVFWGVTIASLGTRRARLAVSLLVLVPVVAGGVNRVSGYARERGTEARALDWAIERARPGDVVVSDSVRAINRLRFRLSDMGAPTPPVYAMVAGSDISYWEAPVVKRGDVYTPDTIASVAPGRILWIAVAAPPDELPGFVLKRTEHFVSRVEADRVGGVYVRSGGSTR